MANQLAANPWKITDVSATPIFLGNMQHAQIEYCDYSDPSHLVEVQDRYGNVIARLKGADSLTVQRTGRMGWVYGLLVPPATTDTPPQANMPSGYLLVYFE